MHRSVQRSARRDSDVPKKTLQKYSFLENDCVIHIVISLVSAFVSFLLISLAFRPCLSAQARGTINF